MCLFFFKTIFKNYSNSKFKMKKLFSLALTLSLSILVFAQTETVYPTGLKVGDKAPNFKMADQNGKSVQLNKLLKQGPVVLVFYRGEWCSYCNKQISKLSDSLGLVKAKGASVVTVTMETVENVKKTIEKTKADFPVLADRKQKISKEYKVAFAVNDAMNTQYKKYGIDIPKSNGKNGASLPVPATYIIGTDGKIKWVYFNTDFRQRPSIQEIIDNI